MVLTLLLDMYISGNTIEQWVYLMQTKPKLDLFMTTEAKLPSKLLGIFTCKYISYLDSSDASENGSVKVNSFLQELWGVELTVRLLSGETDIQDTSIHIRIILQSSTHSDNSTYMNYTLTINFV